MKETRLINLPNWDVDDARYFPSAQLEIGATFNWVFHDGPNTVFRMVLGLKNDDQVNDVIDLRGHRKNASNGSGQCRFWFRAA
jgi:hypothetical protein